MPQANQHMDPSSAGVCLYFRLPMSARLMEIVQRICARIVLTASLRFANDSASPSPPLFSKTHRGRAAARRRGVLVIEDHWSPLVRMWWFPTHVAC